jgi:hypothetical protein
MKKLGVLLSMLLLVTYAGAATNLEAIDLLASKLVLDQGVEGCWPGENDWTGTLAAGMVKAASATGETDYVASAEKGLDYILNNGCCDYFGDELYAMSLNRETVDVVKGFFDLVEAYGTWEYVGYFGVPAAGPGASALDRSAAIFYMSHITVAAYTVDAKDKDIFRTALIQMISEATDAESDFPVMSLGVGLWALAQTGALDSTNILNTFTKVSDLPNMLLSHQVPAGQEGQGSFYWRIDHGTTSTALAMGYTDDTVYGTLGLVAAYNNNPTKYKNLKDAIALAQGALLGGVAEDGTVYEHLSQVGEKMSGYGAKMIQALAACRLILNP